MRTEQARPSDNPLYVFFMEQPVEVRRACLLLSTLLRSDDPDKRALGEAIGDGLGQYTPEHIDGDGALVDCLLSQQ